VPALLVDGDFVANPLVITDRYLDEFGRVVHGDFKTGDERAQGKKLLAKGEVNLSKLDEVTQALSTDLLYTMPDCLTKTIESLRKHKLEHWNSNKETNRAWLSLNMMTEASCGFRAFHYGTRENREADFLLLRRRLAEGAHWGEELMREVAPWIEGE
jgi:6-oxo-cyclohex-1-ene-carbonyl-CoA hydrolase